jgi:ABC-2 type transport system permease protein
MGIIKAAIRVLSVVGKEIIEVLRRPKAVLSLVLGPFLILAVFGAGYGGFRKDLQTLVVVPPESSLPADLTDFQDLYVRGLTIVGVVEDRAVAEQRLRAGEVDLVVVTPADPMASIENGEQAELDVVMNLTDPVEASYAQFLAENMAGAVNREIYKAAATEGKAYSITIAGRDLSKVPPEVIASPTKPVFVNLAPVQPTVVGFYGPAALALVLQHMAVTLIALSIVRERAGGAIDRLRASPMRATEVVAAKVAAFALLGGTIAAVSIGLMVGVLGVPLLGSIAGLALIVGLLLITSLGLGLFISVISDSERQAVQLSLLVLLASMFFSGFVIRIEDFHPAVQVATYFLPVTHGIALLQDQMLLGVIRQPWQLAALAAIGAVLLALSWMLLRRELRPR